MRTMLLQGINWQICGLNKRKKAIAIIKNDGVWPNNINVDISIERNEEFYQPSEKYTISDEFTADENRYFLLEQWFNNSARYFTVTN